MLPRAVQAASSRQTFDPAGAGAVLLTATAVCIGVGALIGWAAGSIGLGILGGAVVGVPAGIAAVYRRYRDAI
jgi:F0F1-type ATP synthase assembly protein I